MKQFPYAIVGVRKNALNNDFYEMTWKKDATYSSGQILPLNTQSLIISNFWWPTSWKLAKISTSTVCYLLFYLSHIGFNPSKYVNELVLKNHTLRDNCSLCWRGLETVSSGALDGNSVNRSTCLHSGFLSLPSLIWPLCRTIPCSTVSLRSITCSTGLWSWS